MVMFSYIVIAVLISGLVVFYPDIFYFCKSDGLFDEDFGKSTSFEYILQAHHNIPGLTLSYFPHCF